MGPKIPGVRDRLPRARGLALACLAALVVACGGETFTLDARGPFPDSAIVSPSLDRVAILVTIANRSGDDLLINPADFVARDAGHRVYPANPTATTADARLVSGPGSMRGTLPLPTVTLRSGDVLSGFVVFDVPAGVQPSELVWRQTDSDSVVAVSPGG
jgi:hypothetical protein